MIRKRFESKAERDGPRTFRFTISTGAVDRERDTINPEGWDLAAYRRSPVILWSHDASMPAIARTVEIGVAGGALKATAEFPADGLYPFADQVRRLLAEGYLSSASVGFRPLEKLYNAERGGWDFKRQELLEWSICNVGALPTATVERRGAGIDRVAVSKWLNGRITRERGGSAMRKQQWEQHGGNLDFDLDLSPSELRTIFDALQGVRGGEAVRQAIAEELHTVHRDARLALASQRERSAHAADLARDAARQIERAFEGHGGPWQTITDQWGHRITLPV